MDKYDELIKEIDSYRRSYDIEITDEVISIADLKNVLEYKFKGLRDAVNNPEMIRVSNGKLFMRVRIAGVRKLYVSPYGELIMMLKMECGINNYIYVRVSRFSNEINVVTSDKNILNVIKKGEVYLNQIFDEMLGSKELLMNEGDRYLFLDSGMFQFWIRYTNEGEVGLSPLKLALDRNENDIGDKTWLYRKTINEVIKENSDKLYSKVPIAIESLPLAVRNAIYEYLEYMKSSKLTLHEGGVK